MFKIWAVSIHVRAHLIKFSKYAASAKGRSIDWLNLSSCLAFWFFHISGFGVKYSIFQERTQIKIKLYRVWTPYWPLTLENENNEQKIHSAEPLLIVLNGNVLHLAESNSIFFDLFGHNTKFKMNLW